MEIDMPIVEWVDFENGMAGWDFKFWLPPERKASAEIIEAEGFRSPKVLRLYADGRDDDGIFYLQRTLKGDIGGDITQCGVSWWFTLPSPVSNYQWPRVAYIGKPIDLDAQDRQKLFHYFNGMDGLTPSQEKPGWYAHLFKSTFSEPLPEVQICIGWKINWETERTFLLDDIVLSAR